MPKRSAKKKTSKKSGKRAPKIIEPEAPQRLQRLLAAAGYGSRRQCEDLIEAGRVEVDGEIVSKLGATVDATKSKVRVDGVFLRPQKKVYYAVNKPVGIVTTNRDPHGRPRVIDLVPKTERVFPVGRLDRSSEGLILLTNDGDLAQQLAHPKYGVRKVYRVTVAGKVEPETMRKMREGIYIAEGHVKVEGARIMKSRARATEMEIVLREGKNREIRRILARMGHKVQTLRRIAIGTLRLGEVPPGAYRVVSREEVRKLKQAAEESRIAGEATHTPKPKTGGPKKRKSATRPTANKTARKTDSVRPAKRGKPTTPSPQAKLKKQSSRSAGSDFNIKLPGFESDPDAGAVIGGDAIEKPRESKRKSASKRGAGGSRTSKKRTGKGSKKRSSASARSGTSKRSTSSSGGSRGAARTGKKSSSKKRTSKKGVVRKRKG